MARDSFKVKENVGSATAPLLFEWVGGKGGYLWVGEVKSDGDERCVLTLSPAQSRKLAAFIQTHQSDDTTGASDA